MTISFGHANRVLDTLPHGRIIKDVMRHESGGAEERKKRLQRVAGPAKMGKEPGDPTDTYADDEIDPADFFDPEEFGFYRREPNASRP